MITSDKTTVAVRNGKHLNDSEKAQLKKDEQTIQSHFNTFREAGEALVRIRQARLYREQYVSFEEYCRRRWDMSKTQANRLIAASQVIENLKSVESSATAPVIDSLTESAVRPLTQLKPATQRKVIERAIASVPATQDITARFISQVARQVAPKEMKSKKKPVTTLAARTNAGDLVRRSEILEALTGYARDQKKAGTWATLKPDSILRAIRNLISKL